MTTRPAAASRAPPRTARGVCWRRRPRSRLRSASRARWGRQQRQACRHGGVRQAGSHVSLHAACSAGCQGGSCCKRAVHTWDPCCSTVTRRCGTRAPAPTASHPARCAGWWAAQGGLWSCRSRWLLAAATAQGLLGGSTGRLHAGWIRQPCARCRRSRTAPQAGATATMAAKCAGMVRHAPGAVPSCARQPAVPVTRPHSAVLSVPFLQAAPIAMQLALPLPSVTQATTKRSPGRARGVSCPTARPAPRQIPARWATLLASPPCCC